MITFKAILIVILLLCLLPMPYMYYEIVRWTITIAAFVFAYVDNEEKSFLKYSAYVIIGVLFNPLFNAELPRLIWNIIDVIVAGLLITEIIIKKRLETNQQA